MAVIEQTRTIPVLTDQQASDLVSAAEAKAKEIDAPMVIAVVDAAGLLKLFVRMNGTPRGALEWTIEKAYTAAAFGRPTAELAEGIQSWPAVMASMVKLPSVNLTPGGHPLLVDGKVIGGLGVGGGSPEQDAQVADAGLAAFR